MKNEPKGTKEQIAKSMAQHILAQVSKGKSAPEAIKLLQLNNGNQNKNSLEEKIILEDKSTIDLDSASVETLDNGSSISPSPEENELLVEGMQEDTLI
jgi:hypothetical protein